MNLHQDRKLFSQTLYAAAQHLGIKVEFVEKDYWITLILSRLAKSKYVDVSVFKGGTSLSKGYHLIDRFSEDVDIAIINDEGKTGNEIKARIRAIEKEITVDLNEMPMVGVTSKGSRFRKSVFEYKSIEKSHRNNKVIVEINSFANPFPFQRLPIRSMVFDFFIQTQNEKYIELFNLGSFEVNVLSKEQTLLEKMVSLIRSSFQEKAVEGISGKIRHFYDIYYLLQDEVCLEFIASDSFKQRFKTILEHDLDMFEEPLGWQTKSIYESPLIDDFPSMWKQLKVKFQAELSALAYRPIPDEREVARYFSNLMDRIK